MRAGIKLRQGACPRVPSLNAERCELVMLQSKLTSMSDASWAERAVLGALLLISLGLFWWRFQKVLHVIRASRVTRDFALAPFWPRIRQFLWEVMLQGKVIEQRP